MRKFNPVVCACVCVGVCSGEEEEEGPILLHFDFDGMARTAENAGSDPHRKGGKVNFASLGRPCANEQKRLLYLQTLGGQISAWKCCSPLLWPLAACGKWISLICGPISSEMRDKETERRGRLAHVCSPPSTIFQKRITIKILL